MDVLPFAELPKEIIGNVMFSYFLPDELAKLITVCKAFLHAALASPICLLKLLIFKRWGYLEVTTSPSSTLYFGNLKEDVREVEIYEMIMALKVNDAGPIVTSIRVVRDHVSRASKGYAYVNFDSQESAQKTIGALNFQQKIHDRWVNCSYYKPHGQTKQLGVGDVFVGGLTMDTTEKMVFDFFRPYGALASVALRRDESGFPKGTAFVQFDYKEDAIQAILKLHGTKQAINPDHGPTEIVVQPLAPKAVKRTKPVSLGKTIVIKHAAYISEEKFRDFFSKFGEISKVTIIYSKFLCFIQFVDDSVALRCVEQLKDSPILYTVGITEVAFEQPQRERLPVVPECNVLVKHIPLTKTEEELTKEMEECGPVLGVSIAKTVYGFSRGFGFVCFANEESVIKAFNDLNVPGKYGISKWKPRDEWWNNRHPGARETLAEERVQFGTPRRFQYPPLPLGYIPMPNAIPGGAPPAYRGRGRGGAHGHPPADAGGPPAHRGRGRGKDQAS